MARVENTAKEALKHLLQTYFQDKMSLAEHLVDQEEQVNPPLDPAYKAGIPAAYKKEIKELVQSIRWFFNKYSIPIPKAFTDAEMDARSPNARTHEE